jgi:hypothetical protein
MLPQLEDLQEEAWRLSMYAELERMRLQLSMLQPLEEDASGDEQPATVQTEEKAEEAVSAADKDVDAMTLSELDEELAAVNAELKVRLRTFTWYGTVAESCVSTLRSHMGPVCKSNIFCLSRLDLSMCWQDKTDDNSLSSFRLR